MHGIFSHFVQWQSHEWLLSFTSKWYTLMWALSTTISVHLPSIICNHSPPSSFHCSISGRCLSSLDEQWVYACNTPQSDLDKHSRSHSRRFKRSRFPIHRCLLQRQQTVHVHQQLGRNNFQTTPWSSQPYRVHTRSLATNRTDKREGIVNRNRSS